jgi:2,3-bisphosphoglycerate-independent phosphoglycerate mutase
MILLVKGEGKKSKDILASVSESYAADVTDEFITPILAVDEAGDPYL